MSETVMIGQVTRLHSGEVIATNVTADEYMEQYAAHFCEWVAGTVVKMSPVHMRHDDLSQYLIILFQTYFAFIPVGTLRASPFVMRLDQDHRREPDLQIILNTHADRLKDTYVDGAADICLEIVSPGSIEMDYATKFEEYQQAGVQEYWIFDPLRQDALFYRRNDAGELIRHYQDSDAHYRTPLLPDFALHLPTLWRETLPNPIEIMATLRALLQPGA